MEKNQIINLFAKVSKLSEDKFRYFSPEESEKWEEKRAMYGVKRLKRKALGIFGPFGLGAGLNPRTIKSLDEMGKLLYGIGVCSSLEQGKKIGPELAGHELEYGFMRTLSFEKVENNAKGTAIKITAHYYGQY